ncbi:MAG: Cytochrome c-type biogenesis protein DsbD, protein-disulfide reductase (EC [uncultured Thiotrichaceae bacterium]|uniref:Thiol:disulfide interchange protein DsbD n=1 Tax=uncultured Thiotrichaceae bacterium TaxID=298394 RepID=A0A6S6TPF9_9GAMM|nr:MAG: Cytochrome c-type biogenesis protein DsbD, protein-disulfide reductase (EC [uncultured Thiotrichaceae bacterium]
MINLLRRASSLMHGLLLMMFLGMAVAIQPVLGADGAFPIGNLGIKALSEGNAASSEPLLPDDAFAFSGVTYDGKKLAMSWTIASDYYLYRGKFKIRVLPVAGLEVGEVILPPGKPKKDEFYGTIQAMYAFADATLPVTYDGKQALDLVVEASWQGCAESLGICYPPMVKQFKTSVAAGEAVDDVIILDELSEDNIIDITGKVPAETQPVSGVRTVSEQDRIANMLSGDNTFLVLLSFLGFGLLLSFTPCVFPMIPILSGIIAGQKDVTPRKAFMFSLVYVLAMALTYTVAGVLAGLFGSNLSAALQTPWILGVFSAIFVLLSLSMFGFYELQIPAAMQTRLNEFSNKQAGGSMIGVAIMGVLSALIVGPCVAAPLAGALIYIGLTGDAVLGGMALFALSLGMGIPLLVVGTLAGNMLPRAGMWMEAVKAVFGVLLLGVAIWMLERVLPMPVIMLLWALLIICSAVYMGATTAITPVSSGWSKLWKGVGIVMLLHGGALMVGAAAGGNDVLQPLKGVFGGGSSVSQQKLAFRYVDNLDELKQALTESKGRTVMFDFYADWCPSCKEMEKYTFPDPAVKEVLSNVVLLKADVTANNAEHKALMANFGIVGPPAMLFFDTNGQEQKEMRLVGFLPANTFAEHVRGAKALPAVP